MLSRATSTSTRTRGRPGFCICSQFRSAALDFGLAAPFLLRWIPTTTCCRSGSSSDSSGNEMREHFNLLGEEVKAGRFLCFLVLLNGSLLLLF